jgi:hypothetical protein
MLGRFVESIAAMETTTELPLPGSFYCVYLYAGDLLLLSGAAGTRELRPAAAACTGRADLTRVFVECG